jgi:hypothetical protein
VGDILVAAGADPRPILVRQLDALDRARAIGGDSFEIYTTRAGCLVHRAQYEMSHGLDPSASLDQAVAEARRAVDLAPANDQGLVTLGFALGVRADHVAMIGGDPERDVRAALDNLRSLKGSFLLVNLVDSEAAYTTLADWKVTRGQDPRDEVAHVAELFGACVKAAPDDFYCYDNMGWAGYVLSEYQVLAQVDPREALSHAVEHFEKSRALFADGLGAHQALPAVHLLRAEDASHRGEDPAPALAAFAEVLTDCYRVAAKDPVCTRADARRSLLLADIAARAHRPERPSLDRAAELARLAVDRNARDADNHQVLADAERRLAALPSPAAEQAKHRAAGLDACARGLAVNPNHPRLLATQGALLLLDARAAHDAAATAESAKKALAALRRAVELNPLLRREVGELLDEAERFSE